jgi:hypothetical protein
VPLTSRQYYAAPCLGVQKPRNRCTTSLETGVQKPRKPSPDATTRSEAVSLARDLGPRVASVFDPLVRAVEADGDTLRHGVLNIGLPALASVGGEQALPLVLSHLDNASSFMRISAAVTAYDRLSGVVGDSGISLR